MTAKLRVLLGALLILVAGACDGSMRTLNLREPRAPSRHWDEFFMEVVRVPEGADVQGVVAEVAQELGLLPDPEDVHWFGGRSEAGFSFTMVLEPRENGVWLVKLMDWPTTRRSGLSRQAELGIRSRLEILKPTQRP
jgi:hypothetical protein